VTSNSLSISKLTQHDFPLFELFESAIDMLWHALNIKITDKSYLNRKIVFKKSDKRYIFLDFKHEEIKEIIVIANIVITILYCFNYYLYE